MVCDGCLWLLGWVEFWIHVGFISGFSCWPLICLLLVYYLQCHLHFPLKRSAIFFTHLWWIIESHFWLSLCKLYIQQDPSFRLFQCSRATILWPTSGQTGTWSGHISEVFLSHYPACEGCISQVFWQVRSDCAGSVQQCLENMAN